MRARSKAQSLVEMALLAPLLITIIFLIVDAGFWIYGYGTIYNAARRASEQASKAPPESSRLNPLDINDRCVSAIANQVAGNALFFYKDGKDIPADNLIILYPPRALTPGGPILPLNSPGLRRPGGQIQVTLRGQANFLTPIPSLIGLGKSFTVEATSRRTIEGLALDPNDPSGIACQPSSIGN